MCFIIVHNNNFLSPIELDLIGWTNMLQKYKVFYFIFILFF